MKTRAVSYGAVELKHLEHRYMAVGLGVSVAIHLCFIAGYILKGVVFYDRPPFLPPNSQHPFPGPRQIEVFPNLINPTTPQIPRGSPKHVGGKYAKPVPVPLDPTVEDSLLFRPGDTGPGGDPGPGGIPGNGEGPYVGSGPIDEEQPPDFRPVERVPVVITRVEPVYPELAIKAGLEGKVWVRIWVDREGKAHKAEVLKSSAEIFNDSALAAAMQFVFVPAYMNEGPVAVWVSIPFTFKFR
jgi:protein TonB